jgi:hypothetical protein
MAKDRNEFTPAAFEPPAFPAPFDAAQSPAAGPASELSQLMTPKAGIIAAIAGVIILLLILLFGSGGKKSGAGGYSQPADRDVRERLERLNNKYDAWK